MIIKTVSQVGNPVIRAKSVKVSDPLSKGTQKIVKDLTDSMRYHGLVGMAAPQIGSGVRIFVTEIQETKDRKNLKPEDVDPLRVFINPVLVSSSKKEARGWEGCGSVACSGLFGMVKRPSAVVIKALNEKGEPFQITATNLLARVIQHEMDHLNGIVFVDKADTKTYMSRDEYRAMRAQEQATSNK